MHVLSQIGWSSSSALHCLAPRNCLFSLNFIFFNFNASQIAGIRTLFPYCDFDLTSLICDQEFLVRLASCGLLAAMPFHVEVLLR